MNRDLIRPLVLVHGLWNTPKLFDRFIKQLDQTSSMLFVPHLPHDLGRVGIRELAVDLNCQILNRFGTSESIDILGFSMGGLISRVWLQEFKGHERTIRFFSIGSPHRGTLTAQFVPSSYFLGISEMKLGSKLLSSLDNSLNCLKNVQCKSYFCFLDLMVFPGYRATLPIGNAIPLPVITHKGLIRSTKGIKVIVEDLLMVANKPTMSN